MKHNKLIQKSGKYLLVLSLILFFLPFVLLGVGLNELAMGPFNNLAFLAFPMFFLGIILFVYGFLKGK
ncbi:MAG: hypothetical protein AAF696_20670 [Bacteroidota bacterium]